MCKVATILWLHITNCLIKKKSIHTESKWVLINILVLYWTIAVKHTKYIKARIGSSEVPRFWKLQPHLLQSELQWAPLKAVPPRGPASPPSFSTSNKQEGGGGTKRAASRSREEGCRLALFSRGSQNDWLEILMFWSLYRDLIFLVQIKKHIMYW